MSNLVSSGEAFHSRLEGPVMPVPWALRCESIVLREWHQLEDLFARIETDEKSLEHRRANDAIGVSGRQPVADFDRTVPHLQVIDAKGLGQTDPGFGRFAPANTTDKRRAEKLQPKLLRGFRANQYTPRARVEDQPQ